MACEPWVACGAEKLHGCGQTASGCSLLLPQNAETKNWWPLGGDPAGRPGADLLCKKAKIHGQQGLVSQGAALGPDPAQRG